MGRVHAAVGAAKALIAAVGTEALAHGGRNAMRGLGDIRLLVAQGAASRPLGISWVKGFAGDSMERQQRVQQGRHQGSRPAFAGLGALHSSAQHLEGEEHAAQLAPCEKQPEQQPVNELDQRLAESGHEDGAAAVLALVEGEGGRFTERNVLSAIQAVAEASNRQGASGSDIVRSPGFQTLVDMMLAGLMRFEPGLLAQAVRSCGELGASEEMLLDEIGRHLMKFVDQLTAADVAALVHGYALLDHSPSVVLFDALAARAAEVADDFTAEQRAQLVSGYERLAYAPKVPAALT